MGTSADPAATSDAMSSGEARSRDARPSGDRAIDHTAAAKNCAETPVCAASASASASALVRTSPSATSDRTGRTASAASLLSSSGARGHVSSSGVARYISAAAVVSASGARHAADAPRSADARSAAVTPSAARNARCSPSSARSTSRASSGTSSPSSRSCSRTRASTAAAATRAHPSSGDPPLLPPRASVFLHVSTTLSAGSHAAFTRTGGAYSRPSLRALNASSWNASSSASVNGGGVRGRSPRRTTRAHDARSSARAASAPKDAAACISPNTARFELVVETACACVTTCESTPSLTGLVAAANAAGSPSAAARFRALAARRTSARSMPAMDAHTARAVSLATRDDFRAGSAEPGSAAARHLPIARAHVLTSASSVLTLERTRGSRANDATVSDAARRTSSFPASAASATSAPNPPDLIARLRQSPSRINVEASARAAVARRPAHVSASAVPPAVALEAPHALTSAAKDGSRRAYAARNALSTARTPTAPTACSKSATASEDALETGSADAGSAEDASPPALVSPTDAEDAASAVGGSARATGASSGASPPTLSPPRLSSSSAGARAAGAAVAFLASSASSRSSAALAASSSAATDATTAPLPLSPSSAPLNPSAASKPARPRAETARLQAAASAYRLAAGVTILSSASISPTTASNASGASWKSSAPRARASVAISHRPCAAASTSAFVMTLARASSPPSSPSGSPPLEHHSPARRASARSVSRRATSHGSGLAAATAAHAAASFTSSLGAPEAGTSGSCSGRARSSFMSATPTYSTTGVASMGVSSFSSFSDAHESSLFASASVGVTSTRRHRSFSAPLARGPYRAAIAAVLSSSRDMASVASTCRVEVASG